MPAETTTLTCPSCGAKVKTDDFNQRLVCEYCGNEHLIHRSEQPILRPEIAQPANVFIENDTQSVRLVQRWFSWKYIPMALFALVWDAFLFFWYSTVFRMGAPTMMAVFPLVHVGVGIWITYTTIAGFINSTILEVNNEEISVWFYPLPWMGEKKVKTRLIKQFFCKDKYVRNKNGGNIQYELWVMFADNQQMKLVGNLDSPDIAIFFEQQMERWLHIADRPVAGEIKG